VNKSGEHPLKINDILKVQCKLMYLCHTYQFVLDEMPDGKTWEDFCEKSIEVLCQIGIIEFNFLHSSSLAYLFQNWRKFSTSNPFIKLDKEVFVLKPEKSFIIGWIRILSCSIVIWQLLTQISLPIKSFNFLHPNWLDDHLLALWLIQFLLHPTTCTQLWTDGCAL